MSEITLTSSQNAFLDECRQLTGGDRWLLFVNAGFTMEDALILERARLIETTRQMGMPAARLRPKYTLADLSRIRDAAPELLEALKAIMDAFDEGEISAIFSVITDEMADAARAAIAKAEGRT